MWASQLPPGRLQRDGPITRLRGFEHDGACYRRIGIRRWKRLIPDAGRFGGGRRKVLARPRSPDEWAELVAETRRAERVHWCIPLALVVLVAANRGPLLAAMVAYAVLANLPCIATQRYNRGRLVSLLGRHGPHESGA